MTKNVVTSVMTNIDIVRKSSFQEMPWPNGAGVSWKIATEECARGRVPWSWQFSTALIDRSVPFSFLPGIDRIITLIAGDGFRLSVEGSDDIRISQPFAPASFPGDRTTHCHVPLGQSIVLNLLFQRERFRATASVLHAGDSVTASNQVDVVLLFALAGRSILRIANDEIELGEGDAGVIRLDECTRHDLGPRVVDGICYQALLIRAT